MGCNKEDFSEAPTMKAVRTPFKYETLHTRLPYNNQVSRIIRNTCHLVVTDAVPAIIYVQS